MSLRDGAKKMSKSDPSDMSRINMTDDADAIANKIRRAKTDPAALPGVEVLGEDGTITLRQTTYIEKLALTYLTDDVNQSAQSNKTPCDERSEGDGSRIARRGLGVRGGVLLSRVALQSCALTS